MISSSIFSGTIVSRVDDGIVVIGNYCTLPVLLCTIEVDIACSKSSYDRRQLECRPLRCMITIATKRNSKTTAVSCLTVKVSCSCCIISAEHHHHSFSVGASRSIAKTLR